MVICGVEFSDLIRRRRMIRHYADRPVAAEVVERVLTSALRAPSAGYTQGWAFLALTEPADRARFWPFCPVRVERTPSMQNAPLVVVVLAHKQAYLDRYGEPDAESTWPAPYWFVDVGMAALLMLLSAVDEGLGACFFGIEKTFIGPLRAEYGIPEEYSPVGAVTVGYRAADLAPQDSRMTAHRRPMAEVVHRGHWSG